MGVWQQLTSRLIDTHCHLNDYDSPEEIIAAVKKQGIKVHLVTVHPWQYEECLKLTADCKNIKVCLGMFPLDIDKYQHEMERFWELLPQVRFVGEIGLDFTADNDQISRQIDLFKRIVDECSAAGNKVLSIHSRRAAEEVLEIIGNDFKGTVIMHWYSGPAELIKSAPDNVYFSVNTAMLKSRKGKEVLEALPQNKILTETDGPYVKINENSAVPADISVTVNSLSARWGVSIEEAVAVIEENYKNALSFSNHSINLN